MVPLDRDFISQSAAVLHSLLLTYFLCTKLPDRRVNRQRVSQLPPHLPLLNPVECFSDGADVGLFDYVTALGGSGQEKDLFLDVGGEVV